MEVNSGKILSYFVDIAKALDTRNDKAERIVQLARTIVMDSKRIIFKLHRAQFQKNPKRTIHEAEENLERLQTLFWAKIAHELDNESCFYFKRHYYFGLQEYIEALSFFHFIRYGTLISLEEVQKNLTFKEKVGAGPGQERTNDKNKNEDDDSDLKNENEKSPVVETETPDSGQSEKVTSVYVSPDDFMLGLLDLTGELMRAAINSDKIVHVENISDFLRLFYEGVIGNVGYWRKFYKNKVSVLQSSLVKVELYNYNMRIRPDSTSTFDSDLNEEEKTRYDSGAEF